MTVDQLVQRHRYTIHQFQISGRDAASDGPSQAIDDPAGNGCVVLVSINGGGIYVSLVNSGVLTADVDPCQTATDLATKIVAALPAGS